jgi:three-Cys-motif partner protein
MAVDIAHYDGREPAFVKHTFLDKYLPALIGKVCSRYDEFVYVDGFAGPWKSAAGEEFEDTSFGIALNHMTAQRLRYLSKGRDVKMRAFLIEKDTNSFAQLQQAIKQFSKIEVTPINGMMEEHAANIASLIPSTAFSFTLIDPKGFPEINKLMPLLELNNAEALVNFMFDFANRFGGTDLIPRLEAWLSLAGKEGWRELINGLSGVAREQVYENLAVEALREIPGFAYAPVITVDKVLHNRPLYKLIFLSRHSKGLEVFRYSEAKTLGAQAEARSAAKSKMKAAKAGMSDLFANGSDAVPNDRSSQVIRKSKEQAPAKLAELLIAAGAKGIKWSDLWPSILKDYSVTRSWLGRHVNEKRKSGELLAPEWPSTHKQIPDDAQRFIWAKLVQ